ncbi:MAG TPA: zinc-binding alcohol dehydrogenase family protein [Terriglobales bacterium]
MKAAVLRTLGQAPRCEDFPDPVAADGEALVRVVAASLKPVDRQIAAGSHYASPRQLPCVCGLDGVGLLLDGKRVLFGGARAPYGAMAEFAPVRNAFAFPLPDGINDETAAALPNPAISAWLTLAARAKVASGENVLILGATGVTGRLAVQIAKLLGAARVVAAGRNAQALDALSKLGADAAIRLDTAPEELKQAFLREAGKSGFQVVIDYVWGAAAEAFLAAITNKEFAEIKTEIRYVQVGEAAGATIALPAAVLRSTAITIMGTAGIPSREILADAMQKVFMHAADGTLQIDTVRVPLTKIESAWQRDYPGRRVVVIP